MNPDKATDGIKQSTQKSQYDYDVFGNVKKLVTDITGEQNYQSTTNYSYLAGSGQASSISSSRSGASGEGVTTVQFDGNGQVRGSTDSLNAKQNTSNSLDANGHIWQQSRDGKVQRYFYVLDQQVGDSSSGVKKAVITSLNTVSTPGREGTTTSTTVGSSNQSGAVSNFDLTYQPISQVGLLAQGSTAGKYAVQAGDTLRSIAQNVWGDASLWWMVADANGFASDADIRGKTGQEITLPNRVTNLYNSTSTFRPYNAQRIIGDLSPTLPSPPPPPASSGGCGTLGIIAMIVVAIVVTVLTYGAASGAVASAASASASSAAMAGGAGSLAAAGAGTAAGAAAAGSIGGMALAGAAAGIAGSLASQLVGVAMGMQDDINWRGVAAGALTGAVSGGLGIMAGLGSAFAGMTAVESAQMIGTMMVNNAAAQGINIALGQQQQFSWAQLAMSGATAYAGQSLAWAQGPAGSAANQVGGSMLGWAIDHEQGRNNGSTGSALISAIAGSIGSAAAAAAKSYLDPSQSVRNSQAQGGAVTDGSTEVSVEATQQEIVKTWTADKEYAALVNTAQALGTDAPSIGFNEAFGPSPNYGLYGFADASTDAFGSGFNNPLADDVRLASAARSVRVGKGDTLQGIAARMGVDWRRLGAVNGVGNDLRIGMEISTDGISDVSSRQARQFGNTVNAQYQARQEALAQQRVQANRAAGGRADCA